MCKPMAVYCVHSASATRRDPVRAQRYNVETLVDLSRQARWMPRPIREGVRERLRVGRLNLGYSQVRAGRRIAAVQQAVIPSLVEVPGWRSIPDTLSMVKG